MRSSPHKLPPYAFHSHTPSSAGLNTVTAVEDVLTPILEQIVDILKCLVNGVEELADIPVEQSLADVATGVELDVGGIVDLVGTLLVVCKFPSVLKPTLTPSTDY